MGMELNKYKHSVTFGQAAPGYEHFCIHFAGASCSQKEPMDPLPEVKSIQLDLNIHVLKALYWKWHHTTATKVFWFGHQMFNKYLTVTL